MDKLKSILALLKLDAKNTKTLLAALSAKPIALYDDRSEEMTKWLPLIVPDVDNMLRTIKGDWRVDAAAIVANFHARGIDMAIDYEHQSLGDSEGNPMIAPAAGWISDMTDVFGVVFALVEWNPTAREMIKNKEYKYLSPAICTNEYGAVVALFDVALTNVPATINAIPIALSGVGHAAVSGKEDQKMDRATLIATLGLSASATDADITAALRALRDAQTRAVSALSLSASATAAEIEGKITGLAANSAQLPAVQAELAKAQAELAKIQAEAKAKNAELQVTEALSAGKITPAQKEWATGYALSSPEGFAAFLSAAQPVVPIGEGLKPAEGKTATALSANTKDIFKNLGVSEEDIKKYGGQK